MISEENNKKIIIGLITTVSVITLVIVGLVVALVLKSNNEKNDFTIKDGVHIAGIDVSGLSQEKAREVIEEKYKLNKDDLIYLCYENYTYGISIEQIEAKFDIDTAVENAYGIGRDDSSKKGIFSFLSNSNVDEEDIKLNLSYNKQNLRAALNNISPKLPKQVIQPGYYIEGKKLIITSGSTGLSVNVDEMEDLIVKGINRMSFKNSYYSIVTITEYPKDIDVDQIHNEIYQKVQNAYYTKNPRAVYAEVKGVDFKNSVEEVKQMIASEKKEEYEVALKITYPKVTTDDLGQEAFPNKLATFSTHYPASNTNRTTNLRLAAKKINGTVIMPGETFSYNKVVGPRTRAAGYKNAAIYENGGVTDGLGGGICQITTTLYNAVVFSNLEIVSRQNHSFVPSYVTGGRDATVVYGAIDFKFKNNRNYPVKIRASVSGGIATVSIYGLKTKDDYKITISSRRVGSYGGYTTYKAYKHYKKNGKTVKTVLLSTDTYKNH